MMLNQLEICSQIKLLKPGTRQHLHLAWFPVSLTLTAISSPQVELLIVGAVRGELMITVISKLEQFLPRN